MTAQKKDAQRAKIGTRRAGFAGGILSSLLLTLLLGTALTLLFAFILSRAEDGTAYVRTVGCAISALLAFVGGLIAGGRCGHSGILSGLAFGALYLGVLLLLGGLLGTTGSLLRRLIGYAVLLLLAALGGAAGTARPSRRRHRGRPHRVAR